MNKSNIIKIIIGTALILSVPLIAMQFSDDVQWDINDFVVMGVLLVGAGLVYEFVSSKLDKKYRALVAIITIAAVLLTWAELAVGIF